MKDVIKPLLNLKKLYAMNVVYKVNGKNGRKDYSRTIIYSLVLYVNIIFLLMKEDIVKIAGET